MKRVTLYTKSGCTSCQKARQFLLAHGIHFAERDIFKHPLDERELRALAAQKPLAELFSHRSPSVKALGLADRQLSEEEMLRYMLEEPRLIRRPLLRKDDEVVVGFDEARLGAFANLQAT